MAQEKTYFLKIWSLDKISDEHLFLSIAKNIDKYKSHVQLIRATDIIIEGV